MLVRLLAAFISASPESGEADEASQTAAHHDGITAGQNLTAEKKKPKKSTIFHSIVTEEMQLQLCTPWQMHVH